MKQTDPRLDHNDRGGGEVVPSPGSELVGLLVRLARCEDPSVSLRAIGAIQDVSRFVSGRGSREQAGPLGNESQS